ncbi:MAG: TrmH family RNA methyltransferase [Eubacteriales bacterium]|nr:TrmH family RNA methyltransferase [Eubacteriales bacterium]
MAKLEPYSKKLDYSYALGVFPALKLMECHPEKAFRLLLRPDGLENQGVVKLREICGKLGVREEMAEKVLRRESKKDNCFAAVAFEKYDLAPDPSRTHAVLCQISDGGNAGTAMRSLLGFGLHDVALVRPCVDVFDPHVLRASMGAFFHMRVRTYDHFQEYRLQYPHRPLYPFMLDGAKTLDAVADAAQFPCTLIFGNEQTGLPSEFAQYGQSVLIPQSGEVDSLNLAVAVSVGAYVFAQKGGFLHEH